MGYIAAWAGFTKNRKVVIKTDQKIYAIRPYFLPGSLFPQLIECFFGKIQIAAVAGGIKLPQDIRNPDRVLEGIELEREARAQLAKDANSTPGEK